MYAISNILNHKRDHTLIFLTWPLKFQNIPRNDHFNNPMKTGKKHLDIPLCAFNVAFTVTFLTQINKKKSPTYFYIIYECLNKILFTFFLYQYEFSITLFLGILNIQFTTFWFTIDVPTWYYLYQRFSNFFFTFSCLL